MSLSDMFPIIIPPRDISCEPGLLEKLAGGDREAFAWVYKNYCKKIYDYALLMTINEAMSEDIVQEVFLKLWRHREKLPGVKDFNSYLYTLYKNYTLDVLKAQQKEIKDRNEYSINATVSDISANDIIDDKETEQVILKAVKQLPKQQQMVYRLTREYGWNRGKIAEELNLAPNTVKAHMQLALRFLREKVV